MRISTLSTTNRGFQDDKVSLRKLSQIKSLNKGEYYQQQQFKSQVKPYMINVRPQSNMVLPNQKQQSHIQWIGTSCCGSSLQPTQLIINPNNNQTYSNQILSYTGKQRTTARRKIFQHPQLQQHPKKIMYIPTLSNVLESANGHYQQQTQYYSPQLSFQSRVFNDGSQSLGSLTTYHIPKLQRKLKQHDQQLMIIKEYLKNAQKLSQLKDSIKQFQQVQMMRIRQEEVKGRRLMIMNQIEEAKLRLRRVGRGDDERVRLIEDERIKRLERIKMENEQLRHDLTRRDCQPSPVENNYNAATTPRDSHRTQPPVSSQYRFSKPNTFPSNDWNSHQQMIQLQTSKSFQRSDPSKSMTTYLKGHHTEDLEVSSALRRKMNQISAIGLGTNNKVESFSLEANTFRDFTSPLDFQGENQSW